MWYSRRLIIAANIAHRELSSQQRAGLVVWWLVRGERPNSGEICAVCGSSQSALRLMHALAVCHCAAGWQIDPWPLPELGTYTPQQRAAVLAWYLAAGARLTNDAAARLVRCSVETARRILCALSAVLPIWKPRGQAWRVLSEEALA